MRRMVALQEQNRRLEESSSTLNKELFGDIPIMREMIQACEKTMHKRDDPVITQIYPYEPIVKDKGVKDKVVSDNVEPVPKVIDKGKQKMVCILINEPMVTTKNNLVMSKLDLELEKARKEKEDLAKELEKVENEVVVAEMRR